MTAFARWGGDVVKQLVVVRPDGAGGYTAQAVGIPEIQATERSRAPF